MAAVGVAGMLASVPLALPVDDLVAHELAVYARALPGATGDRVLRAVSLRRRVEGSRAVEALADLTRRRVERAWQALVEVAAQRVGAVGSVLPRLDRCIEQHVEGLERVHAAVDERFAQLIGLGDGHFVVASVEAEAIESEVRALAELNLADI
jgi:hypothetical protein